MAPKVKDTQLAPIGQDEFESLVQEQIRQAVRLALVTILEAEVEAFIGALPYERSSRRRDQRNGYYSRSLDTTVGRVEDLPVPRTRQGFKTQLFRRYQRRRQELDTAISEIFIREVSTRHTGQVNDYDSTSEGGNWVRTEPRISCASCTTFKSISRG